MTQAFGRAGDEVRGQPEHLQRMTPRVTSQGTECQKLFSDEFFTRQMSDDRSNRLPPKVEKGRRHAKTATRWRPLHEGVVQDFHGRRLLS
ncbi:hypothetical protein, partial [Streptomyces tendae]